MKKLMAMAATGAMASVVLTFGTAGTADAATVRTFKNCTELNRVYPHGVGLKGARDHTSGKPVTNFARKPAVYKANKKSDRDKDGIACEKA